MHWRNTLLLTRRAEYKLQELDTFFKYSTILDKLNLTKLIIPCISTQRALNNNKISWQIYYNYCPLLLLLFYFVAIHISFNVNGTIKSVLAMTVSSEREKFYSYFDWMKIIFNPTEYI